MFSRRRTSSPTAEVPTRLEATTSCVVDGTTHDVWERLVQPGFHAGDPARAPLEAGWLPGHQLDVGALQYEIHRTDDGRRGEVSRVVALEPGRSVTLVQITPPTGASGTITVEQAGPAQVEVTLRYAFDLSPGVPPERVERYRSTLDEALGRASLHLPAACTGNQARRGDAAVQPGQRPDDRRRDEGWTTLRAEAVVESRGPVERIWDVIVDPIPEGRRVPGSSRTGWLPGHQLALGALQYSLVDRDQGRGAALHEIVELEPGSRLVRKDISRADADAWAEYTILPREPGELFRVRLALVVQSRGALDPQSAQSALETQVRRAARGLAAVLAAD